MKKILLLIMFIPFAVLAEEYTPYREYKMETDEIIDESELIKKEEIKLYNTYREEMKSLGFLNDCAYKRSYNSYITEPIKVFMDYRYLTRQDINIYNHVAKNIFIGYFNISNRIYDIKVTQNGKKVDYNLTINDEEDKDNILGDNNKDTYIDVNKTSGIQFFFNDIKINDLLIEFDADKEINSRIVVNAGELARLFEIDASSFKFVSDEEFSLDTVSKRFPFLSANYYPKTKNIYECFKNEKIILNEYVKDGNNLIKDDYIIKYNYYIRDKIIPKEEPKKANIVKTTTKVLENKANVNLTQEEQPIIDALILPVKKISQNNKKKKINLKLKEDVLILNNQEYKKSREKNFFLIIFILIVLSTLLYFLAKKIRKCRIYFNHKKNNI